MVLFVCHRERIIRNDYERGRFCEYAYTGSVSDDGGTNMEENLILCAAADGCGGRRLIDKAIEHLFHPFSLQRVC